MAKKARGDKNLLKEDAQLQNIEWHNPRLDPFVVEGLPWLDENNDYGRLPKIIRKDLRETLDWVAMQPSGICIRCKTDSKRLAIRVQFDRKEHFPQNPLAAESGFDVYLGHGRAKRFLTNLNPVQVKKSFTADCALPDGEQEISIYFPLLNPIKKIEIGLVKGAAMGAPTKYKLNPIMFYGSSITQGYCCSRSGLTYPAQVCRNLNAPLINMGFGGNARGDLIVAEAFAAYAAENRLSAFVYDYDHNSPPDELKAMHAKFFKVIRKACPDLPILIVSSPVFYKATDFFQKRFCYIEKTFKQAKKRGDKHVGLLPGKRFFSTVQRPGDYTVDNLHPNDLGFRCMADAVTASLKKLI